MKAETQDFGPKEHEGFLTPRAEAVVPAQQRSWSAASLAAVCTAATIFFFLFSQAVLLRGRPGGAAPALAVPSPPWPYAGGSSSSSHGSSSSSSSDESWSWSTVNVSRTLQWQPCGEGKGDGVYDCARLDVPMDWQDPSVDQRVVLAVVRRRATDTADYRGPVFFNPGGPGASGVYAMRDRGELLHEIVGELETRAPLPFLFCFPS